MASRNVSSAPGRPIPCSARALRSRAAAEPGVSRSTSVERSRARARSPFFSATSAWARRGSGLAQEKEAIRSAARKKEAGWKRNPRGARGGVITIGVPRGTEAFFLISDRVSSAGGRRGERRSMEWDPGEAGLIVVGAGAAGLMASLFAARAGARVLLLESTREGGKKILISGGGRCNILPSRADPTRFVSASSPHSLRKILACWPLPEQRRFFEEELGVRLVLEPETGKLFPASNRAREVRDALLSEAARRGVRLRFECPVAAVLPESDPTRWRVILRSGEALAAPAVILATGGLSVPATGSDGRGLEIASDLGHRIHPTYPALTPLLAAPPRHGFLAGVSLPARLSWGATQTRGSFLFTHQGYSGPAVLDISHCAVTGDGKSLRVAWGELGPAEWEALLRGGSGRVDTRLKKQLPDRLALTLLDEAGVPGATDLSQLRRPERLRLVEHLAGYRLPVSGPQGYRKAEVTGGGVALEAVRPDTMESRTTKGLFLCGEMLDAFGPIGGHNFQWAWATGRAAGLGAARSPDVKMTGQ